MDEEITMEKLIESLAIIGHKKSGWHPKIAPYLYGEKKGIHIIDPEKTLELLNQACIFIKNVVSNGGKVLFVATKKNICEEVKRIAIDCGAYYCTSRWLGGTLTNFVRIRQSIELMSELEIKQNDENLTKKERRIIKKKLEKMKRNYEGIKDMTELPKLVYIVDIKEEKIAVSEAKKIGIPIVAIVDTDVDPTIVDYPIPANDESIKSVRIITSVIGNAIKNAKMVGEK